MTLPTLPSPAAISVTKDILVALAAVVTAASAVYGVNRWQRELRGRADFEVARGLARAAFKLRDELESSRSPLVHAAEFPAGYSNLGENTAQAEAEAWAHVYQNRWAPVMAAVRDLDAQALEAEALWGGHIRERTQALRQCAMTLNASMRAVIDDKLARGDHFRGDPKFAKRMRADVSATPTSTDNPLSNEITAAVRALEAGVRRNLRSRS